MTTDIKLCQSLMPQAIFVTWHNNVGLFVKITSISDGGAVFVKQVARFTRLLRSKTSHTDFKALLLVGTVR